MKHLFHIGFVCFLACYICSCFYIGKDTYTDIIQRPSDEWSSRDALTVIATPMEHNLFDSYNPNIKVIATPYYPSVVLAIQRNAQRIGHWTEEQFRANTHQLLLDDCGMYCDWSSHRFVDHRGNYLRTPLQFDSLLFLVTIENGQWPCNIAYFNGTPMWSRLANPCFTPGITDLEQCIFLINEQGDTVHPRYVWGRQRNILTMPETLFAMFPLHMSSNRHFLHGSDKEMYLIVHGLDIDDVRLTFPLEWMR